jgi:hypothetical protein
MTLYERDEPHYRRIGAYSPKISEKFFGSASEKSVCNAVAFTKGTMPNLLNHALPNNKVIIMEEDKDDKREKIRAFMAGTSTF